MAKKSQMQIARTAAIYDLQNMLHVISRCEKEKPNLLPDGIFDAKTRQAVMNFQREAGLTANGVVDSTTWNAIAKRYYQALENCKPAEKIGFFSMHNGKTLQKGDSDDAIYAVQIMFDKLADEFDNFKRCGISGNFDNITEDNIKTFQNLNKFEPHGRLDRKTWNRMILYHNLFHL